MSGAVFAAIWLMLAPPPATPDVVQTQPQPAGQASPAQAPPTPAPTPDQPSPAPMPPQPDGQTEEPQAVQAPDSLGEGAAAQEAWEQRLHAAYDNAEARQGPLDGRWKINGQDGDELFVLVLSDPEAGNLVGAWRDLRRGGGADGSGYLSMIERTADGIYVRFIEPGQGVDTVIELRLTADGSWGGELTESGAVRSVVMKRF